MIRQLHRDVEKMVRFPSKMAASHNVDVTKNNLQCRPNTNPNFRPRLPPSNSTPTTALDGCLSQLHYHFYGSVLNLIAENMIR